MIRPICDITIGSAKFDYVNFVSIDSSWENLTDTCRIILPNKLRPKKDGEFLPAITGEDGFWKRGDPVSVALGYDTFGIPVRFKGYVTKIITKNPLTFECEDEMWKLKQTPVKNYSKSNVTLGNFLKFILPQYTIEADPFEFSLRFTKVTAGEVLEFLKKKFGITCYFQNGILRAGFSYRIAEQNPDQTKEFEFQKNIIEDQLEFTTADDVELNVTVINVKKDNTIDDPVVAGSPDGEKRVIYTYNLPQSTLKNIAEENLVKLKYTGFKGSFLTFLNPVVKHGDSIKLINKIIPDQNGVYIVKRVLTTSGISGGRQEIFLDRKIA
jgi:hypothetical protein